MVQPLAVDTCNASKMPLEPLYLEGEVVLEAGGLRLTVFYQEIPGKLLELRPETLARELDRLATLRRLWIAVQNLSKYGKVQI